MLITKTIEIDMGHRIPNHKSKCKNLHGHRYKIEVGVDDKIISKKGNSSEGMVIDFGDLKNMLMEVIDKGFDHSFMVSESDPYIELFKTFSEKGIKINYVSFIPTVENISRYFYILMKDKLKDIKINLQYIKIFETPTSSATYSKEDESRE